MENVRSAFFEIAGIGGGSTDLQSCPNVLHGRRRVNVASGVVGASNFHASFGRLAGMNSRIVASLNRTVVPGSVSQQPLAFMIIVTSPA
jgi:hypothetical protein